ncbi:predicted protein [Naegleria gruberi]|uniref:Predicted protein n=1 Tax=Naegleria gruberi TaxID=5762 RepID=D2VZG5_NAEGR|nr:uncharacterized protein NAEGRDRAFT_74481 [Naegleria gruberi]EFC37841.1 predicted protein [Naegleria gruberi]|eukprot:XP_002670585.1 predicted protein [Naegleria gruberi strain NEG-M]
MPDYGEHIYLMDTKTGQVLDKIKAKGVDKSNGGLYGFGYDELNHNLILSTCTFGPHYYYTIYHLSKQMKVVNKTYCSNPPTQFALDLYKKKIYFATASKPIIDCYDSDYKKKVPVNVQNSPLAFFFLKKCKYLAIVTDKKFVVHD